MKLTTVSVFACIVLWPLCGPAQKPDAPTVAAEASDPLPELNALLHDVEGNDRKADKLRKSFSYHIARRVELTDSKGNVKKVESAGLEVYPTQGVVVSRVVERDGKPISDEERTKDDKKIEKAIKEAQERRAKMRESGGDMEITTARVLELGAFSNERRVMWNGRKTIAVDYRGDSHAKVRNRFEEVFKLLEGTVWIDEEDRVIVRGEGHFIDNFKIAGGLAVNVHKGLQIRFENMPVGGGIWQPKIFVLDGSARVFLLMSKEGRLTQTYSDYHRYGATSTVLPGAVKVEDGTGTQTDPVPQTITIP